MSRLSCLPREISLSVVVGVFANSDVVLLVLNNVPLVKKRFESLIRLNVLIGQVTHLFHVDFLEQRGHIDTLNDFHDLFVEPLVVQLVLIVLFDQLRVVSSEDFLFAS